MTDSDSDTMMWLGVDSRYGTLLAGTDPKLGLIEPGTTVVVAANPQIPWKGERLYVRSACASSFLIHAVQAGHRHLFAEASPVPADAFAAEIGDLAGWEHIELEGKRVDAVRELAGLTRQLDAAGVTPYLHLRIGRAAVRNLGEALATPTLTPGWTLSFFVENIGDRPCRFSAGMLGRNMSSSFSRPLA